MERIAIRTWFRNASFGLQRVVILLVPLQVNFPSAMFERFECFIFGCGSRVFLQLPANPNRTVSWGLRQVIREEELGMEDEVNGQYLRHILFGSSILDGLLGGQRRLLSLARRSPLHCPKRYIIGVLFGASSSRHD